MIILLSFVICVLLLYCYELRREKSNLSSALTFSLLQYDDAKKKVDELEIKLIKAKSNEIK